MCESMSQDKALIVTLRSTFEGLQEQWNLERDVEFAISPAMHDLYLEDLPRHWADAGSRRRMAVIGPNDYFYKWRGDEFGWLEESPLAPLLDRVEPRYAEASRLEGKISGLPLSGGNHQLMFVNKRYVEQIPQTFDELLAQTWQLRNSNTLLYPFVFPTNACYFVFPLLYGNGAPLWTDPQQPDVGITLESLIKTFGLIKQLMYDDVLLPVKWEQYHSVFEFQTGRAAFCFGGDWDIKSHLEVFGDQLAIAPIPSLERPCRSTANCNYLFLSSQIAEQPLAAVERLARLILSDVVQRQILREIYRYPVLRGMTLDGAATTPQLQASYDVFAQAIFLPPYKIISHIFHVLADLLEPGVLVKYPLEELMERAYVKMQDVNSPIVLR
jgi:ABC-type glycerol-3-phosphate transport system substrate-binding protein